MNQPQRGCVATQPVPGWQTIQRNQPRVEATLGSVAQPLRGKTLSYDQSKRCSQEILLKRPRLTIILQHTFRPTSIKFSGERFEKKGQTENPDQHCLLVVDSCFRSSSHEGIVDPEA